MNELAQGMMNEDWVYSPGTRLGIFFRGDPDSYEVSFCGWISVQLQETREEIKVLDVVAREESEPLYNIDPREEGIEVRSAYLDMSSKLDDESTVKDSRSIREKLNKITCSGIFFSELCEELRQSNSVKFSEQLSDRLKEALFPGSPVDLEIYLYDIQEDTEQSEAESKDDSFIEVIPHIKATGGTYLRNVREGELFLVRIVGETVKKIKDEFVESKKGRPRSIPIPAKLMSMEPADPSTVNFMVKLSKKQVGRGQSAGDTKVHVTEGVDDDSSDSSMGYIFVMVPIVVSLVLAGLWVLLFPGSVIRWLMSLTGGV
ncbi:MAG: hypothetical protein ABEJ65_09915 [bacterium]